MDVLIGEQQRALRFGDTDFGLKHFKVGDDASGAAGFVFLQQAIGYVQTEATHRELFT